MWLSRPYTGMEFLKSSRFNNKEVSRFLETANPRPRHSPPCPDNIANAGPKMRGPHNTRSLVHLPACDTGKTTSTLRRRPSDAVKPDNDSLISAPSTPPLIYYP